TSGVDLVRPHLGAIWPGQVASYRIGPNDQLVLWTANPHAPEITYHLDGTGLIQPVSTAEVPPAFAPLPAKDLLFNLTPLPWSVWVEAWDRHTRGASGPPLLRAVQVFPVSPDVS